MGNNESSCYDFRKEEKFKSRGKIKKNNFDKCNAGCSVFSSSTHSLPTSSEIAAKQDLTESNDVIEESMEKQKDNSSGDDAYTPINETVKSRLDYDLDPLDPRSPSDGINRTPLHIEKIIHDTKPITFLDDPRSPTVGISRTPILQQDLSSSDAHSLIDPRSPSAKIQRTPLNVPNSKGNLRRAVLLTNTLNFSPVSDSNACSLDTSNHSYYETAFSSLPKYPSVISAAEESLSSYSDAKESLIPSPAPNKFFTEGNMEMHDVIAQVLEHVCSVVTFNAGQQDASNDNIHEEEMIHPINSKEEVLLPETIAASDNDEISMDLELASAVESSVHSKSNPTKIHSSAEVTSNELKKHSSLSLRSYIPMNSQTSDRKRRANVEKSDILTTRNENESALQDKREKSFKKIQQRTARSPLTVLSHRNSPEPKRLRSNVTGNEKQTAEVAASTEKKSLVVGTSRLPRYKTNNINRPRS